MHMQRTLGQYIRGLGEDALPHLDQILLPTLQRLVQERPMAQGRVRLHSGVCQLLWHLAVRWHDLVRSQRNPNIPASTHYLKGWLGRFKSRHFVGLMARGMA